jgi:hypothetical protein
MRVEIARDVRLRHVDLDALGARRARLQHEPRRRPDLPEVPMAAKISHSASSASIRSIS